MKFAKQLEENAIPEWKSKYLDYKQAKKKLKAAARAIRSAPSSEGSVKTSSPFASLRDAPVYSFLNRERGRKLQQNGAEAALPGTTPLSAVRSRSEVATPAWRKSDDLERQAHGALPRGAAKVDERSPLRLGQEADGESPRPRMARYGSIIGSPPSGHSPAMERLSQQATQASLLELPDPALDPDISKAWQDRTRVHEDLADDRSVSPGSPDVAPRQPPPTQLAHTGNAYDVTQPVDKPTGKRARFASVFEPRRTNSGPLRPGAPFLRRVFSIASGAPASSPSQHENDVALEAYREYDFRKAELFNFLEKELAKVEEFYKLKEEEASRRLSLIHQQLHIMRRQRLEEVEIAEAFHKRKSLLRHAANANGATERHGSSSDEQQERTSVEDSRHHSHLRASVVSQMDNALDKVKQGRVGKTSKAMRDLGTPSLHPDHDRDYQRRYQVPDVSYRSAKQKLKVALTEYYRSLELLRSYATLNQTGFRKIAKKCDKTLPNMPTREFIRRANRSYFVESNTVDHLMHQTEDYYARYFERGNRSRALDRLRARGAYRNLDHTMSTLRAGFLLGIGLVLSIVGLTDAYVDLKTNQVVVYLLQIYAGYFFLLLSMICFCLACRFFSFNRINYVGIFELNRRSDLDHRQLLEITTLFFATFGLTMTLNFSIYGDGRMYMYWPVLLIGLTVVLLFLPLPVLYWKSRRWFVYSIWRVFFSGIYPVEFRDLFFGDVFCSQTYAFGNIELFFCLYAHHFTNAKQCASSVSMLFGFFTTLPGIMRAAQCFRRYITTKVLFPHIANFGKYCCTILSYVALSQYRIHLSWHTLALFIAISTTNSVYCIFWDIFYDFSLGNPKAKHALLRNDMLFSSVWIYYVALVVDPIIRFNWIFYAIYTHDTQHSTIVSFMVALSEVLRRALWALLRVENEQCAFNRDLKATREPPLPYGPDPYDGTSSPPPGDQELTCSAAVGPSPVGEMLRRVGSAVGTAHVQDYVRRRPAARVAEPESDEEEE